MGKVDSTPNQKETERPRSWIEECIKEKTTDLGSGKLKEKISNEIKEQRESKSTKESPNLTTENKKKGGGAHLDVAGHRLREGSGSSTTARPLDSGALTHGRTRAPVRGTAVAQTPFHWLPRAAAATTAPLGLALRKQRKGAKRKEARGSPAMARRPERPARRQEAAGGAAGPGQEKSVLGFGEDPTAAGGRTGNRCASWAMGRLSGL